jgi:hypothetical protein
VIIILEGPDGAGKTTLARTLTERYKLLYWHEGPTPQDAEPLYYYGAALDSFRGKDVVIDRFALGERVYGPLLRGEDRLGDDGWRIFQRLARAVGAWQILCQPDFAVCEAAWKSDRRQLFRDENIFLASYNRFAEYDTDQDFVYDFQHMPLERLFKVLERGKMTLPAGMVGAPGAKYLFVGDRGNLKTLPADNDWRTNPRAMADLPFFATVNSSAYLSTALARGNLREEEIAFINAYRWDGTPRSIPQFPRVVALGAAAAHQCRRQGIQFKQAPHPQYWRRFHRHQFNEYVRLLGECCQ